VAASDNERESWKLANNDDYADFIVRKSLVKIVAWKIL
jgi:hypothetical protein